MNRDHARPRGVPAPSIGVVEARLEELVRPATDALAGHYRRLGLRWRVLTLPVMVARVLAMIWRQVPSVSTLARLLARERLLWEPPRRVTQRAPSLRLRCLPAELFASLLASVLPDLLARAAARRRPLPPAVARARRHFGGVWATGATTLEALFGKVGTLRGREGTAFGGKLLALLDLATKLPVAFWLDEDAAANEKRFLDRLRGALPPGVLLVMDAGFFAFPWFDWLGRHGAWFLTPGRAGMAYETERVLAEGPALRDRVIRLGLDRSNRCDRPVRLVEVPVGGTWRAYLTNVLDPAILPAADVVDLYGRRWRIEEAFLTVKRLLGLSYLWTGAANGVALQVWATWLLYAVLADLSDAVAEELDLPLDRISIEMVYRVLYSFACASERGEADDPVAYLSSQPDLGIVKRPRRPRSPPPLDSQPGELNL